LCNIIFGEHHDEPLAYHWPSVVSKAKRHRRDHGSIANEQQQQEEAVAHQRAAGGQPLSKG